MALHSTAIPYPGSGVTESVGRGSTEANVVGKGRPFSDQIERARGSRQWCDSRINRRSFMKLVRVGQSGAEVPGVVDADGKVRSLANVVSDIGGATLTPEGLAIIRARELNDLPELPSDCRLGPPISSVGKIICVGLNYRDHAAESGMAAPNEPVLFFKATSAICGPFDDVVIPTGSRKTDWEVELGVVIGRMAKRVSIDRALDHVGGYLIVNDLSEREAQLERGGQWVKGKSYDTFGPIGPWLVTRDELPNPESLALWLSVNGRRRQHGHTSNMIFSAAALISYISQFMTLMPGDIISTGTPAGVGLGLKPPQYLQRGDQMELGIDHLGTQRHRVIAETDPAEPVP